MYYQSNAAARGRAAAATQHALPRRRRRYGARAALPARTGGHLSRARSPVGLLQHRCGAVLWAAGRFASPTTPATPVFCTPGLVSAAMLEMYGVYGVYGVNFRLSN
jgi:hypothetical protein